MGIHLTFDLASLTRSTPGIAHYLGISTGKEYDPNHPIGIPEYGAAKKHHLEINGVFVSVPGYGGIEPIHVSIRAIAFDMESIEFASAVRSRTQICEYLQGISGFEVGFAIEVLCLHVCNIVLLRRCAYQDVRGDGFVVHDLDEFTHTNVFPQGLLPVRPRRPVVVTERIALSIQCRIRVVQCNVRVVIGVYGSAGFDIASDAVAPRAPFRSDAPDERPSFPPGDVGVEPFTSSQDPDSRMVNLTVGLVAFYVFIPILDGCDAEDDEEGKDDETRGYGRKFGEKLKDSNEGKEAGRTCSEEILEEYIGAHTCWRSDGTVRASCEVER